MIANADDDRLVDAIAHLRRAMSLLNEAGALQSAAHVASAIFCMPSEPVDSSISSISSISSVTSRSRMWAGEPVL